MKKIIGIFMALVVLSAMASVALAQTSTTTSSTSDLVSTLQKQIEDLKAQIESLKVQMGTVKEIKKEIKEEVKDIGGTLKLLRQLREGMSGDDVTTLQEILATDPDVYPEGLVTGYFGQLTKKAIKKFQKKMNVEQVGNVGPKTLSKFNELLEYGAGKSGKVPPGFLISSGILKKLGYQPQPLEGQKIPCGIEKKLSNATTTATTTLMCDNDDENEDDDDSATSTDEE